MQDIQSDDKCDDDGRHLPMTEAEIWALGMRMAERLAVMDTRLRLLLERLQ
jgi:hypothetical protein